MHPNAAFRTKSDQRDIAFLRKRAFGTLAVNGEAAPLTCHIPFLLNSEGSEVELHLVRSNPIVKMCNPTRPAVLTSLGPDGYVSPDWYGVDDQVPTWNYVAVRITGTLEKLSQDALHPLLDRLSEHFETQLKKTPWTTEKMSDGVMERMMRMIVPFRMTELRIDATWKLNQNKEDAARLGAASAISQSVGVDLNALAKLMSDPDTRD